MATVSFEVSTDFLTRMRTAMVMENPALQGQSNAVINEAARVRVRQMIRQWVNGFERAAASNAVALPGDSEII